MGFKDFITYLSIKPTLAVTPGNAFELLGVGESSTETGEEFKAGSANRRSLVFLAEAPNGDPVESFKVRFSLDKRRAGRGSGTSAESNMISERK